MRKKNTLRKILSVLVDDLGYEEVRKSLDGLDPKAAEMSATRALPVKRRQKPRKKPNAITAVESLSVADEGKRNALMTLARKYEEKAFMPNVNHVRAFLKQQGKDVSRIKSRRQAVSAVFKCLTYWKTQSLRELDARGEYGPPKSLSAIAESIEHAGRQSRL